MVNTTFPRTHDQRLLQLELSRNGSADMDRGSSMSALTFSFASPEMVPDSPTAGDPAGGQADRSESSNHGTYSPQQHGVDGLSAVQEQVLVFTLPHQNLRKASDAVDA